MILNVTFSREERKYDVPLSHFSDRQNNNPNITSFIRLPPLQSFHFWCSIFFVIFSLPHYLLPASLSHSLSHSLFLSFALSILHLYALYSLTILHIFIHNIQCTPNPSTLKPPNSKSKVKIPKTYQVQNNNILTYSPIHPHTQPNQATQTQLPKTQTNATKHSIY